MLVYYTQIVPIPKPDVLSDFMPPIRRARMHPGRTHPGALFAYALAALALERQLGRMAAEWIRYTDSGKPYLEDANMFLSLSHSKTHALFVLSENPIGCDIETHRPISDRVPRRVLGTGENPLDFFAYWTLKESYIKLRGKRTVPFSDLKFQITGDSATGCDTHGFLYRHIPNVTAAILAREPFSCPELTMIETDEILSYAQSGD